MIVLQVCRGKYDVLYTNQSIFYVVTYVVYINYRQAAKELSTLTPLLAAHNVKNVGVGLEEFGLKDFVDGNFFNGDLYVDVGKKTYKDMGYKRFGTIGVLMSLFNKRARDAIAKV